MSRTLIIFHESHNFDRPHCYSIKRGPHNYGDVGIGVCVRVCLCVFVCSYISGLWGQSYGYTPTMWGMFEYWGQKSRPQNYMDFGS